MPARRPDITYSLSTFLKSPIAYWNIGILAAAIAVKDLLVVARPERRWNQAISKASR